MKKTLLFIMMVAALLIVHTDLVSAASTLRFVAVEDGDIYQAPDVGSKVIGKVKQWDLLDVGINPFTPSWLSFETLAQDRTTAETGYYCGNEAKPMVGSPYTFTVIVDDQYRNAPGVLIKVTDTIIRLWDGTVECRYAIYSPLRPITKFVRKEIGIISSADACDLTWRIESLKGKNWPNYINRFCLTHFVTEGMTQEMVRVALGNPDQINVEHLFSNILERWIYNKNYPNDVYFKNGILTGYGVDKAQEKARRTWTRALRNPVFPDYPSIMED